MSSAEPTGGSRGTVALALVAVTAVVAVAALVYAITSFSVKKADGDVVSASDRARVLATAEQFCLRVDGFDGDKPDEYRDSVTALLTTKYKADFNKQFEQIEKLGIQKGQKGKGDVLASGIATMDADSATVLVVHDNTITSSAGSGKQHSRWTINLDKVGGRWLIDDFTPVS